MIDRDNATGIEIVADDGTLVHIVKYEDIDPMIREKMSAVERANAYLIVDAVNTYTIANKIGQGKRVE